MKNVSYITVRDNGEIVNAGFCQESCMADNTPVGTVMVLTDKSCLPGRHYYKDGEVIAYTEAELTAIQFCLSNPGWSWKMPERIAVDNRILAQAQTAKWREIKKNREIEKVKPFTCDGMTFDYNPAMMSYALSHADRGSFEWTLADNSITIISSMMLKRAAEMQDIRAVAMHARAGQLRGLINKATTVAEADAINWYSVI
jgi:hypothetical protein